MKKSLNLIGYKPKRIDKDQAQKLHFQKRWHERVGYALSDDKFEELRDIVQKHGKFMSKEPSGNSVFRVPVDGMHILIVYDSLRRMPITVLGYNKSLPNSI